MSDFDPARKLVMAKFKTVLGHSLPAGTPLAIAAEPAARGEVDEAMARRLHAGGIAIYADDFRPTPVESAEQARTREAAEIVERAEAADDDSGEGLTLDEIPADLIAWQADDEGTGKKAGATVTKSDLLVIAERENVAVETDDNKADLQRKIVLNRAALAANGAGEVPHTEVIGS